MRGRSTDRSWTPRLLAAVLLTVALLVPGGVSAAEDTAVPESDFSFSLFHLGGERWDHPSVAADEATSSLALEREPDGALRVTARMPDRTASVTFTPPAGEPLGVGTYVDAQAGPPALHQPGLDISQDTLACGLGDGEFTVHRLDADLTDVHVSWSSDCGRGGSFGEVRVGPTAVGADGEPGDRVVAAPYAVDWPERRPGETAEPVPVRVANDSPAPVPVLAVTVRGDDAEDVDLTHDCGVLEPGAACTATVAMTPGEVGRRQAEVVVTHSRGELVVPLSVVATAPTASMRVASDQGTWEVLDGVAESTYLSDRYVEVGASDDDERLSVRLRAPRGEAIAPGTYPIGVGPGRGAAHAFLSTGFPDGCDGTRGEFTVRRATHDPRTGDLTSLVASWHHGCYDSPERAVQGAIVWRADAELPALGPLDPWRSEPVGQVRPYASTGRAEITFVPPPLYAGVGDDQDAVTVREREGDEPMTSPAEGEPLEPTTTANGEDVAQIDGLAPGTDHTVTFFVDPSRGEDPPPVTVVLRGTRIETTTRVDGGRRVVRGRLVTSDGSALPRRWVTADLSGTTGPPSVRRTRTGPGGRFTLTVPRDAVVQLAFSGVGRDLGSVTSVGAVR
ncbi:hypothetical protein [Nocardioides sp. CFH 31398]|uniref:hypothetical protein n=1 Tax=Nocardioides sp. CFH 31398 TaxID=2919579 RepID=UPI001F06F26B|nr:hypothetical protein [Nocardioides sp. CFH 31398]MCH1866238.1 hypothetical protein [Nocardioides sp. CFH 31398]